MSLLFAVAVWLSSCGFNGAARPVSDSASPAPTVASVFAAQRPTVLPTATTDARAEPTTNTGSRRPDNSSLARRISIYDDELLPNWSLNNTSGARYNLANTSYVDAGFNALAVMPSGDEGEVLFSVKQGSREVYTRDNVLGISFRLSGGTNYINNDALSVALQGSDEYPYWLANDTSVQLRGRVTDSNPVFSETRLYDLTIGEAIPPGHWVEVVVWLDDLLYDPNYTYVTGFKIKNDKSFQDTYYIDQVNLLVLK